MKKLIRGRGFKYLLSFLIMFILLISMSIQPLVTNLLGEEILIKTKAYDPRDLFRGDYIRLNYEINEIDISKLDKEILDRIDGAPSYIDLGNKKLYVHLTEKDGDYEVDRVTLEEPKEGIYIEGKYEYNIWDYSKEREIKGIRVDYALDKYFVPENTGKELEEKVRAGEAYAKIKVYRGYPLLKEIILK
ncbi:GDYXXLXY domain-containing protein [Wukongibacter baidiensis]|uniref:GDYXXLXY domain-containing protein n=1 Tax=Wukongibacter baidiensis TaxID=1723361 RepID=UPI003D7FE787